MLKNSKYIWLIGLGVTMILIALPIVLFVRADASGAPDPRANLPVRPPAVNHASLISGEFKTGQEVTAACLTCHTDAAEQVAHTAHFTWKSEPVYDPARGKDVAIGKANLINNYCIGIQGNWAYCVRCHAGYGWTDGNYDFTNAANVDCLVCHDQSRLYVKALAGNPAEGVDLLAAARSVGTPTRVNCGGCHFNGGGGEGVKHGDLDPSLYFPAENVDIHMGRENMLCVDCHQTTDHQIKGRAISVSPDNKNQVACTDCHDAQKTHQDSRINAHLDSVACQTCHIPAGAVREPTKMEWDWSTAGQDLPDNQHEYLKIKGSFVYESNIVPSYAWYNGTAERYLLGDVMDPSKTTNINLPRGNINDPTARIFPFKVHQAKQPYDTVYNILLQPKTAGEGGYWDTFDWESALRAGSEAAGIAFSGKFGFAATQMYWPISHMVVPTENVLQCTDCHGEGTRLDWAALGYPGDPMIWGGRKVQ